MNSNLCLLSVAALCLAGCATDQVVVKEAQIVEIPVTKPCRIDPIQKPAFAMDQLGLKERDVFTKGLAAINEIEQRKDYEAKMEAALLKCTEPGKP